MLERGEKTVLAGSSRAEIKGMKPEGTALQLRDRNGKILLLRYLREAQPVRQVISARTGDQK
ncbi:hypothetical protein [Aestuariibius sp. 2305UL40-4]|uniref:hypothetical protein n=1 Tax=Aestuariibius violaceus TaxID=3234132 RepID=UPI00345E8488